MRRLAPFLLAAALLAPVPPSAASAAKTKDVHAGKRHAIQKAVGNARPGTKLRIHPGKYRESVIVDKRMTLKGVGRGRPLIDAGCESRFALEVNANNVTLAGLKVVGATGAPGTIPSEVDFTDVRNGVANNLVLKDTCDAEYGVNVYRTGPIDIRNSRAVGFDDAGFYIGGVTNTGSGSIRVRGSEAYGNNRGVIVEASEGGDIRVLENLLHDNDVVLPPPRNLFAPPTGLLINEADGVLVRRNVVVDNGRFGLRISSGSDNNVFEQNEFTGNPIDIHDLGAGNCGSENASETGDSLPPC